MASVCWLVHQRKVVVSMRDTSNVGGKYRLSLICDDVLVQFDFLSKGDLNLSLEGHGLGE